MTEDVRLSCSECGNTFLFSQREQDFFRQKGLINQPKRCPECRLTNRVWRQSQNGEAVRELTVVQCADCGIPTKVPFTPKGYRPVYCYSCLHRAALNRTVEPDKPDTLSE